MRRRETPLRVQDASEPAAGKPPDRGSARVRLPPPAGVHLLDLPDPHLPARAEASALLRARALQAFVRALALATPADLTLHGGVDLWVLGAGAWGAATSAPYGLPARRSRGTPLGPGHAILAPAALPGRMRERFDPLLLAAARAEPATAGTVQRADVREFVDVLIGVEWGHTLVRRAGWPDAPPWFAELLAQAAFQAAWRAAGSAGVVRYRAAARLLRLGAEGAFAAGPPGAARRLPRPVAATVTAFAMPRAKMPFTQMVWCQGVLAEGAAALLDAFSWKVFDGLDHIDPPTALRAWAARSPVFAAWCAVYLPEVVAASASL